MESSLNQLKQDQVQIGSCHNFNSVWESLSLMSLFCFLSVLPCETTATATSGSVTTSTILSSDTSSMNVYEDQDGQEWRRGRTKTRNKGKQCQQPRPTSVCAALAEKEKPLLPNESSDM